MFIMSTPNFNQLPDVPNDKKNIKCVIHSSAGSILEPRTRNSFFGKLFKSPAPDENYVFIEIKNKNAGILCSKDAYEKERHCTDNVISLCSQGKNETFDKKLGKILKENPNIKVKYFLW